MGNNRDKRKYKRIKVIHRSSITLILMLLSFALAKEYYKENEKERAKDTILLQDENVKDAGDSIGLLKDENREDSFSGSLVEKHPEMISEYSGSIYVELNNNIPEFSKRDLEEKTGEEYYEQDILGRCRGADVLLDKSMMPKEKRGPIGQIKPSGWKQAKYPGVVESTPPYLYNRCHLVAYGLSGQNANERNLITGTRYFNVNGMLPFEEKVMKYLEENDSHVLYRVTPYFKGDELISRGVEMEAYSVEDNGAGVCFHVFIYNVQPGISIDYSTGESRQE